jgi:hypothetical protein
MERHWAGRVKIGLTRKEGDKTKKDGARPKEPNGMDWSGAVGAVRAKIQPTDLSKDSARDSSMVSDDGSGGAINPTRI